jgi:hypothetical protein
LPRLLSCLAVVAAAAPAVAQQAPQYELSAVDRVWSGHFTPFALTVTADTIFVGYYDANRQLSVASRARRDGAAWRYHRLDSWLGWDSHNALAMAVDAEGQLHVAANMHNDPLVYHRTTAAGDVRTLQRVPLMVDAARERRMTYPVFLTGPTGELVFKYRDGGSGNGNEVFNAYDPARQRWRGLLSAPLIDGEGKRNAYVVGPVLGPDKRFHIAWVWRDTPDAATNHDLSYARSADLVRWERSDGTPLKLPIRLSAAEIVDPVPVRGGMINNNTIPGFDQQGRPLVAFHKFDARGNTQLYVARREGRGWRIVQASDWQRFRWDIGGGGSLDSRLVIDSIDADGPSRLRVRLTRDGTASDVLLDSTSLARLGERPRAPLAGLLASQLRVPASMRLNTAEDRAGSGIALAWATRPPNRDHATPDIPEPTVLVLAMPRP